MIQTAEESTAELQRQQLNRESNDLKSDDGLKKETLDDENADDEKVAIESLSSSAEAFVRGNDTILNELSQSRETGKLSLKVLDTNNRDLRKRMAQSAANHNWKVYWNLNNSLSNELVKRNLYLKNLRLMDTFIMQARLNVSRAKSELSSASLAMKAFRAHSAHLIIDQELENTQRLQMRLLKRVRDESVKVSLAQTELTKLQSTVPRDDWTQKEFGAWEISTGSRQQALSNLINNAEIRAEALLSQSGKM
jgi:hypothetical protein